MNLDTALGRALKRLSLRVRTRMDRELAEFGLTAPQFALLAVVADNPGSTNAELARHSFVAAPTMIRMVTAMEEAGLIVRDAPVGRMKGTDLTPKGRALLDAAAAPVQRIQDRLSARAGENEQVILDWLRACAADLDD